jgi:16S rRNA (guanine1207-N2)-methyltransferase
MPQYFDPSPGVTSVESVVQVDVPGARFELRTDRGVFSHGRLDPGTGVLLRTVPAPPTSGVGLDLGCGAGPIALTMALRSPALRVWAVDVNERARALCAANAAAAGAANVTVVDGVSRASPRASERSGWVAADVRFDVIWSNPPIRIGKDALHELLLTWLPRLADGGDAFLVVQKHLGADSLHRWLIDQGFPTSRVASAKGFRILHIHPSVEGHRSVEGRVS